MESEALDPRKPTSEGGRVAADVLAAHAAASTGAGVFPTSHSSPKKPKRAKKEKMTGKEVERAPPIAFQHGVNDMEMGGPMGAPDSAPVGGGAKYVIDMPNPMSSPQSVHSAAAPVDEVSVMSLRLKSTCVCSIQDDCLCITMHCNS